MLEYSRSRSLGEQQRGRTGLTIRRIQHQRSLVSTQALARQKQWQLRTSFTTLLLDNNNLKFDYKDYSKNILEFLTYLDSL